jgi:NAD-dependent deacetylase
MLRNFIFLSIKMKKIVVLTGAGMSAESGLSTFRDSGGLWEQYDVYEVATPEAWARNPGLVLEFYNQRRQQLIEVEPNPGHYALAALEEAFDVQIITQNIDDLHERAGSTKVLHLHGELRKARSTVNEDLILDLEGAELVLGDIGPDGHQLRPHVVWFGEMVPEIPRAQALVAEAEHFLVVGTSLNVYPANGLLYDVSTQVPITLIDPGDMSHAAHYRFDHVQSGAAEALPTWVHKMLTERL